MFSTLRRNAAILASMATIMFGLATPVFSQAPTDAQRSAIRSQCRSDYMAHCASVPPGGEASLQCLQKNMASLSAGCQGAVRAVEPPAAPKAEAPPAAAAKTESAAAPKTEPAPAAAAKPAEAATAPPAPKAAETAAPAAAPKTSAPNVAAGTSAKKPSDAQVAAIRSSCRSDYPKVCAGVPTGSEAALSCLEKKQGKSLGVLSAGRQRGERGRRGARKGRRSGGRDSRRSRGSPRHHPGAGAGAACRGIARREVGMRR